MKYLITENQQGTLMKQLIKNSGFWFASKVMGGPERLIELGLNNNFNEFIDLFNDMDVRKLKSTLWVYSLNGMNIMLYNQRKKEIMIDYHDFYLVLLDGFNLSSNEIRELTREWLLDKINIIVTKIHFNPITKSL
jgi:hypothetical protein